MATVQQTFTGNALTIVIVSPLGVQALPGQSWLVGQPIAPVQVAATGGTPPYSFAATGLPAGLTIDPATGVISGTPTAAGSFPVTVTATDTAAP